MIQVTSGMSTRRALTAARQLGLRVRVIPCTDDARITDPTVLPVDTVLFKRTRKDCPRALTSLLKRAARRRQVVQNGTR